jgi:hypothetical protein
MQENLFNNPGGLIGTDVYLLQIACRGEAFHKPSSIHHDPSFSKSIMHVLQSVYGVNTALPPRLLYAHGKTISPI